MEKPEISTTNLVRDIMLRHQSLKICLTLLKKTFASNVVDHLESIDVKVLSCYPVFKRRNDKIKLDETHPSTSFRLCVDEKYAEIVERSSSWPDYVQVRNRVFNNNSKSGSTRNADVNVRTCSDVKR
ncbi:hypothetical protein HELRODRAFT_166757 [Helobdella robusta]|uniref:Uncharacterized protein n=1 Tax=Helobdella robusta TaxID=6412 RepID=T1EYH1_HELRO|nr:hypothetical protein HELRODRAFT_166757 [Helobdella robusta]ESO11733.1 hypothetical protein HELRODRAFT_166757 [Helobdella robusta]